jgi:hypothetical protein
LLLLAVAWQDPPAVRDISHPSQALQSDRRYIAVVPPSYDTSQKRYPVLYWLYGYEQSNAARTTEIAAYAAAHEFIVVSAGPVETTGEFPLYFPELVEHVDRTFRTITDRQHRGVSGTAMGGFMAIWTAGKYPDLVGSASALDGFAEASVGPQGFPVETEIGDRFNHDDVRTLATGSTAALLDFHAAGFPAVIAPPKPAAKARPATPAPKSAARRRVAVAAPAPAPKPDSTPVFRHADPYPNFAVWGWEVASNRRQPGLTVLENVGPRGFRSSVREWLPGGAELSGVKLSISSPRLYPPGAAVTVVYLRLRDGKTRRVAQKADAQGRLSFDLDGEAYEVGVSPEPLLALAGYEFAEGSWATAGAPVKLRVRFWNKGAARSVTTPLKLESPNPGVQFAEPAARVFGLSTGEYASVPVTFTVKEPGLVRIYAVDGTNRMLLEILAHPPATPAPLFQIADGVTVSAWQHGSQQAEASFGEGNRDNHAAPGESFAILFPDGESLRPAELFTSDACIDNTVRASDSIGEHQSLKYSLPSVRAECDPGHPVRMLARVVAPGRAPQYWSVEFPVWFRR